MRANPHKDERQTHAATLRRYLAEKPLLSPRLRNAIAAAIEALERTGPAPADR